MTVRVGILGFAHNHVDAYCRRWRAEPVLGVDVVCGWDRDGERLGAAREKYDIDGVETAGTLLARDDITAVVIAAETALHAELVEAAAKAGKAIVLQKPLCLNLSEADRICAAVDAAGVPFTLCWQMRIDPQNMKMREMVRNQTLGKVFMVRRRHGLPFLFNPAAADCWHCQPEWNRDLWADDASHPVDFLHWLLGAPETVTAEVETLYNPQTPMDNGIAIYRYADGPLAEVSCSFTNRAGENTTEIVCEGGTIVQNYGDVPSCNVPRPEGAAGLKWYDAAAGEWVESGIPTPEGHGERIAALAAPLGGFLNGTSGPIATAAEGRMSLRMLLATYVSVRDGRRISLHDPAVAEV